MIESRKATLKLVADNTPSVSQLAEAVARFDDEISERRQQLAAELSHLESRLADLAQIDAHDITGLTAIYKKNADKVRLLLESSDERPALDNSANA